MAYIVKMIPIKKKTKSIGASFQTYFLKPYLDKVKWSKSRAIEEAKFHLKGRLWSGGSVKDYYSYKIIKEGEED